MRWKGHRAFTWLIFKGYFPDDIVAKIQEHSVDPDRNELLKKCYGSWHSDPPKLTPECPPPPPYHHQKAWSAAAVEYYLNLARWDLVKKRSIDEFVKHAGWLSHFMGDAIIEPYAVLGFPFFPGFFHSLPLSSGTEDSGEDEGVEWEYRPVAYPLSDAVAYYWKLVERGEEELPEPKRLYKWRRWPPDLNLFPGDWARKYSYEMREKLQREYRCRVLPCPGENVPPHWGEVESWERLKDYVKELVSYGRALISVLRYGWWTKKEYAELRKWGAVLFTLGWEVDRAGGDAWIKRRIEFHPAKRK